MALHNPQKRPNLVYIFADEFRAQAMGFRGEDPVFTPNLDSLARESLVFTHAYSNSPVCSPYRGILFTGKYPYENGVITNCNSSNPDCYLREDARCLTDILSENGYRCGYIGKWHLECAKEEDYPYLPPARWDGNIWDAFTPAGRRRHGFSFWHSYGAFDRHFEPHYWEGEGGAQDRIEVRQWSVEHETDVAVEYIRNAPEDEPFALFLAHNPPHMPFDEVPDKYLEYYDGMSADDLLVRPNVEKTERATDNVKRYFAAVTGLDEQLKRVLDALDEKGIRDDTIVIYTSDHGEMMGSHGRMEKNCCYNEAFMVPMLIRYPARIRPRTTDMLLGTVDLMPTLLTMMGLKEQIPEGMRGRDIGEAILDNRDGDIRQVLYHHTNRSRGFVDSRYTFAVCGPDGGEKGKSGTLLFDNLEDPWQMHNIAEENPKLTRECYDRLLALLKECEDPFAEQM